MYIVPEMIDLGLAKGEKWTSRIHRQVAQNAFLCNPNITNCDALYHNCNIVNKIPKSKIKKVTFQDLRKLGCTGLEMPQSPVTPMKNKLTIGPDNFSSPFYVGKKWTLEIERRPTAINKIVGYITEAHSAMTVTYVFQPNGIDIGAKYSDIQLVAKHRITIPSHVSRRLFQLMREAVKNLRQHQHRRNNTMLQSNILTQQS